ncbi:MAG: isoprenylcysteine carboxylmethyltransferase family protein [Burkholderiaceae bacterium]
MIAPAPVFFGLAMVAGLGMEALVPSGSLVSFKFGAAVGVAAIAASIGLVMSAVSQLLRANTAFDARKSTTTIVTGGAFRISRNPTYLSLALLSIGIALVVPSAWLLATSAVAVCLTHWGVVLREEAYLRAKFGEPYRNYVARVRRWL